MHNKWQSSTNIIFSIISQTHTDMPVWYYVVLWTFFDDLIGSKQNLWDKDTGINSVRKRLTRTYNLAKMLEAGLLLFLMMLDKYFCCT